MVGLDERPAPVEDGRNDKAQGEHVRGRADGRLGLHFRSYARRMKEDESQSMERARPDIICTAPLGAHCPAGNEKKKNLTDEIQVGLGHFGDPRSPALDGERVGDGRSSAFLLVHPLCGRPGGKEKGLRRY